MPHVLDEPGVNFVRVVLAVEHYFVAFNDYFSVPGFRPESEQMLTMLHQVFQLKKRREGVQ